MEHSENPDSKGREVSDWLGKLERQLAGASVGRTRDVPLAQIREVNQEGVAEVQPSRDPLHPDVPQAGQHLQQGSD